MQVNNITGANHIEALRAKNNGIGTSSGAFQAMLDSMLTGESQLPMSWSKDKFGNDAIDNVVKFLSDKCGINANERVPAYELTDVELDWIKSRHPASEIANLQPFTTEEGNLLGDLVFRNIIAPEDAKTVQGALIPLHDLSAIEQSEQNGILSKLFPVGVESNYLEKLDIVQSAMEKLIEYYSEKQGTASDISENSAYVENAKAFSENKQIIRDLLTDIANAY